MARKAKTASVQLLGIPAFPVPIFGGKLVLCTSPQEWDALAAAFGDATGTDGCKGLAMRYYSEEHGRVYAAEYSTKLSILSCTNWRMRRSSCLATSGYRLRRARITRALHTF
jgi:hypothetical protein